MALLRVQELDLQIQAATDEVTSFAPRRADAVSARALQADAVATGTADLTEKAGRHRLLESELRDVETLLERLSKQLYEVTSKQALTALEHELTRARELQSSHEDDILELLETIDVAEAATGQAEQEQREGEAARVDGEAAMVARETELAQKIESLRAGRADRTTGLDAALLQDYEEARRKRLPALAYAETKSCPVCRMVIPPQRLVELREVRKLVDCVSCGRILYGEKVRDAELAAH